jgi:hypothetical protein
MHLRRITFVLPFNDSDDSDGHDSDFENSFELEEEVELDFDEDVTSTVVRSGGQVITDRQQGVA